MAGRRRPESAILLTRIRAGLGLVAALALGAACAEPETPRGSVDEAPPVASEEPLAADTAADRRIVPPPPDAFVAATGRGSTGAPSDGGFEIPVLVELGGSPDPDHSARTEDDRVVPPLDRSGGPVVFARPPHVRGIYLNAWAAGSRTRTERLLALARRTEVNAFVVDVKDATGAISHPTDIPLAQEIGADQDIRIRDLPGLLRRLKDAGVYPIARIVIAKDPTLAAGRPQWAIQDSAGGVWMDEKGVSWSNMYDPRVWEYNVAVAREVAELGFPEVQWDYVRFPDSRDSVMARATYPGADGRERPEAIRAFLSYADQRLSDLDVVTTMDVFGVATAARHDVGIGQLWERFVDRVDVVLPMVYPSHYGLGSYGIEAPNGAPYEIVRAALTNARNRSDSVAGAGRTRPWLQDFTLGPPRYGAPEVRAQIQATYDAGIHEWILWNPSSRYSEAALLPAEGLPEGVDMLMRLEGRLVPVSDRLEYLDGVVRDRIAFRRLGPLDLPEPRFLTSLARWSDRVDRP